MVESLLKFSKTNPVVEISIKVSIGISHWLEPLIQLDPKEVKWLLKPASGIPMHHSMAILAVAWQTVIDFFRRILYHSFRDRQEREQVQDMHKFMKVDISIRPDDLAHKLLIDLI